ncbi:hypothetical protein [Pseudomonas chlororaphis]|uniref:hypothetical protein n=1 Tax=Pseudomonas chlororaphis TaxID=587753 RepID=UPI002365045E|nr:hypothetical protein [Pseudomonas chlororaphis]WDH25064.1 hypothetical protein PUP50_12580 [Pseudomonas chlororaphis]
MGHVVMRSSARPEREGLNWSEIWEGPDLGLIKAWEVGRAIAVQRPRLAAQALAGELPPLNWKGGVERALIKREKFGSLRYLAQWQGLRGEDLIVDLDAEVTLTCTRTEMIVTFTSDTRKLANQHVEMSDEKSSTETNVLEKAEQSLSNEV